MFMSRMVGVSSYPARKSLMGMDSPVRGEAKVRAWDTGGAAVQPNAHSACSRSHARWARQGTLSKGSAFRDVTPCFQQFPETNVIFQIQSSLWLLSSLSPSHCRRQWGTGTEQHRGTSRYHCYVQCALLVGFSPIFI